VIGKRVVFDPQAFLDEVAKLKARASPSARKNLRVAENVTLILPLHRGSDAIRENRQPIHNRPRGAASGPPTRTRSAAARSG